MVTRLSGGLTPADGADPRTFPAIWNATATTIETQGSAIAIAESDITAAEANITSAQSAITTAQSDIDTLEAKNIPTFGTATPSDGQVLTYSTADSAYVPEDASGGSGYAYSETVTYTSNSTWTKADYPGIKAIRVRCQGAGGGGGGTDYLDTNNDTAAGSGGGGGSYAESFILADTLGATESVVIGSGGTGGAGGATAGASGSNGTTGGSSSFASGEAHAVVATGGKNGNVGSDWNGWYGASGSGNNSASTGDITVAGQPSDVSLSMSVFNGYSMAKASPGGGSRYGNPSQLVSCITNSALTRDGANGVGYGAGGNGGAAARTTSNAAGADGGDGSDGVVYVEVYV